MKIALINGSPKLVKSNSAMLIQLLETLISTEHEISHYNISKQSLAKEQYIDLCHMDALVFAFPLYIDAVPSHLLRMLIELEEYMKTERKNEIYVYAMVNNGFYEGHQSHIAIKIVQNWCERSQLHFGQGIGQGAGEMMGFIEKVPLGRGPLKNLGKALESLADHLNSRSIGETMLFSPNLPRFSWRFAGTHFFWNKEAKANGLNKKHIIKRL